MGIDIVLINPGYLNAIRRKFGQAEGDHIGRMVAVPLKRRILGY